MSDCIELKIGDWVTPDSEYGLKKLVFGKAYLVEKIGRISGNWGNYQDVVTQLSTEDGEIVDLKMAFSKFNKILTSNNLVAQQGTINQPSALDKQVSGGHYKGCKIQPVEYIQANGLDYFQGNVIKYTTRHKLKNGKADIEKAIHYLELILELQYGD